MSTRQAIRSIPRTVAPRDALMARLVREALLARSVTERPPPPPPPTPSGDRNATKAGWEKTVGLFDNLPGANRSTRRPELIDPGLGFHGEATDPSPVLAGPAEGSTMPVRSGLLHTVTPDDTRAAEEGSKNRRRWSVMVDHDGSMSAAIIDRKATATANLPTDWADLVAAHRRPYKGPRCVEHDEILTACEPCMEIHAEGVKSRQSARIGRMAAKYR